jgi:hypothetical protein
METARFIQTNIACVATKCTVQLKPQSLGIKSCMGLVMIDFIIGDQIMVPDSSVVLFFLFFVFTEYLFPSLYYLATFQNLIYLLQN